LFTQTVTKPQGSVCGNTNIWHHLMQPDIDDLRIEERVTEEFMGANPRTAAVSGIGLRRRPTFRVHFELWF
jgi:hypothetical protein